MALAVSHCLAWGNESSALLAKVQPNNGVRALYSQYINHVHCHIFCPSGWISVAVFISPKDNMGVKWQNLICLKLQGKEQGRRQRQWRKRLFLSNRGSCITNFSCLEEERHHEKELVCGHSLRSDGELVSWNRYATECSILCTHEIHIFIYLFNAQSKILSSNKIHSVSSTFGVFWM